MIKHLVASICASRLEQEAFARRRALARHRALETQRIQRLELRARAARLYAAWSKPRPAPLNLEPPIPQGLRALLPTLN
jgi:hypothetical protein